MAYYSSQVGKIYHECLGCFAGNNIEVDNMTEGKPRGARLCKICANLDRIGKCTIGIPTGVKYKAPPVPKPRKVTYYSSQVGTIYHECLGCFAGNNIETVNMTEGQLPGARLCKICANLDRIGKCVAGIPKGQPSLGHPRRRPKKKTSVIAYYSKLRPTVYHKYKNCNVGNNMVKGNLLTGTPPIVIDGNILELCETCRKLEISGKGKRGKPRLPRVRIGAKVKAYYSKKYPKIVHICQNCHLGQNIERGQQRRGKPKPVMGRDGKIKKLRLCKNCTRLCLAWEGVTGIPIPARTRKAKRTVSKPKPKVSKAKTSAPKLVKVGK